MSTVNESGHLTLQAAAAIGAYIRVHVDSNGLAAISGATDASVGVTEHAVESGGQVTIKLWTAPGTCFVTANAAVARGARLFPTAAGKVDDAGTTAINLVAMEAATAANDVIPAAPCQVGA